MRSQACAGQAVGCRLDQLVGQDIAGELVVSQLYGYGEIEPATHLLCKSDPPPNGEQRLLLDQVPVEQPVGERPVGLSGQRQRQDVRQSILFQKVKGLPVELDHADGVAGHGQQVHDADLRLDDHRQPVDLDGSHHGAWGQVIGPFCSRDGLNGDRRQPRVQGVPLHRRKG